MKLLRREKIRAVQQFSVKVWFDGEVVGEYFADVLVEDKIILELKMLENLSPTHRSQTVNYLKATKLKAAYLINFGKRSLKYERFIN